MSLEFSNTYRQYKQDTKQFLCWLASTAAVHGWKWTPSQPQDGDDDVEKTTVEEPDTAATEPSPPEPSQPEPTPPLADNVQDAPKPMTRNQKKKNKKKAAAASTPSPATASAANPAGVSTTHAVPLGDFVPMAELVARSAEGKIPSSISQMLDRVIRLREAFAILLDHTAADPESDKTHHHFVTVLKQCRDILSVSSSADAPDTPDKPTTASQRLTSAFAALKVYEPSESFLAAPPITMPSTVDYVLAEDDASQTEEAHVAFAALLQDVLALRAESNKLWSNEYATGPHHLTSVAMAANTAIDFARLMENEVAPLLDRIGGVGEALARHYRTAVAAEGMTLSDDETEFAVESRKIANGCMFEAYFLMEQFRLQCRRSGAGKMPPLYDGRYGWFDEERARSIKSNKGLFDRDRAALFEVLSETAILVQKVKWDQAEDELTRGVRLILQNPDAPLPFWTVFAAQLFLDNIDILATHTSLDRPVYEIRQIARCFEGRAKDTLQYISKIPRPTGWPKKKDNILRMFAEDAPFFDTPVLTKWKQRLAPDLDKSRTESVLIRRNAIFAGVWGLHLLTLFHIVGIEYANAWGAVFATNQLYIAACRRSALERGVDWPFQWQDMMFMGARQGDEKRFWVGSRPKEMADFWKQWRLTHGVSLADLAREPVGPGLLGTATTSTPRHGLVELTPVSILLRGRLGSDTVGKARVEVSLDDVRKILGDSEWVTKTPVTSADDFKMVHQYDTSRTKRFGAADGDRPGPRHQEHRDLSPAKLVNALAYALFGEIHDLTFDYFLLHFICFTSLISIKNTGNRMGIWAHVLGTPNYLKGEEHLPDIVGLIFRAAAGQIPGMAPSKRFDLLDFASYGLMELTKRRDTGTMALRQMKELGVDIDLRTNNDVSLSDLD